MDLQILQLPEAVHDAVVGLEEELELERYSEKGTNGHLFFGRHRILDRNVAVKFYYWAGGRHDEPRMLSELDDRHTVPVLSARFVDGEWAMFQTPYYPRGDLEQLVQTGGLSLHQSIDHAMETLSGISALHARSLLHRDIKPANVFIDDEGRARIGDFGSVRALKDGADSVPGSGHSAIYRPPESFDPGRYGTSGDIYQAGLVLYELLGGSMPGHDLKWLDSAARRCLGQETGDYERTQCVDACIARLSGREKLLDVASLPATVGRRLIAIIRKATRADLGRRYSSPSAMIADLHRARCACRDWRWEDGQAHCLIDNTRVRIVPDGATWRTEKRANKGWRKYRGVPQGAIKNQLGRMNP